MNTVNWMIWVCIVEICHSYVNIAFQKPAYQQYPYRIGNVTFDASNAVDGRKSDLSWDGGQCAFSADKRETAIWWVNLTRIHSIHHITIYFMTNNDKWEAINHSPPFYLGFSLYVSNTTDNFEFHGKLCFKDNSFTTGTIPAVFNISCPLHGQYVIYYNERLENVSYPDDYSKHVDTSLCEVEVYGCIEEGFYSSNCSIPCPDVNCQYCHIETGTCQGCTPGYQGDKCKSACKAGSYGVNCNETCGHCNDTYECFHIDGLCLTGCEVGYHEALCKSACDNGTYGFDCNETCGHCRDENQCMHSNGICLTGCDFGYQEPLCKTRCMKGTYGMGCQDTCGHCLDLDQCFYINGTCLTGCDVGFQGDLCKTPCYPGYYGVDCKERCGSCHEFYQCFHINGTCLTGCDAGYHGEHCKTRTCKNIFLLDND